MTAQTPGRLQLDPKVTDVYRANGWWDNRSVVADFLVVAAAQPDTTATVCFTAGTDEPTRRTYGELELLSRRVAAMLIDLGVQKGDVVSLQLPNGWEFVSIGYGILRAGATVNPLVPILRHRDVEFIVGRTESSVVFTPTTWRGFDYAAMAAGVRERVDSLEHIITVGDSAEGALDFAELIQHPWEEDPALDTELAARRPDADDLLQIQFTSGTTGEPKGVLHTHNTVKSGTRAVTDVFGLGGDDVCFMASTLAHQTGFALGMVKPLSMGATIVYQDVWDAEALLHAIESERIAWTVSATAFAVDLIAAQERTPHDLSSFRYFVCGGAPIPPKVVEDARRVLDAELIAVWGMTENLIVTATRPGDPVGLVADSDGQLMDHMELRIVDEEGLPVAVGESGALHTRGPSQFVGYFHRSDLYEDSSRGDGWFDTGDIARLRPDGGIRIVGRTKDLIIRGGENVPVAEVEDLLLRHPGVTDVAVVAIPDDRLGERGCAVIVPAAEAPSLRDLTSHLENEGMAKQFWPERLEVVDEMPRTPSGKIQKYVLRERFSLS